MNRFLRNSFFFILPILVLAYPIDVFISKNLKKSNKYAEGELPVWNDLINGNLNSDILIYGSSRAWVHFDTPMITRKLKISTYNLGIDGHNFRLQYLRHKFVLKSNKKPKLIIISTDHSTIQQIDELYNSEQFLPYMFWNEEIKSSTYSYTGFKSLDFYIPLIRYYGKNEAILFAIRSSFGHFSNPAKRVRGYYGRDEIWVNNIFDEKNNLKAFSLKIDNSLIELFEKFIKDCQKQNIKLVFVNSPMYIKGQNLINNRKDILNIYSKFSKKYNIPFYDFSNDPICWNNKYFYNANHLNKTGAELFTKQLIDTLKIHKIDEELRRMK